MRSQHLQTVSMITENLCSEFSHAVTVDVYFPPSAGAASACDVIHPTELQNKHPRAFISINRYNKVMFPFKTHRQMSHSMRTDKEGGIRLPTCCIPPGSGHTASLSCLLWADQRDKLPPNIQTCVESADKYHQECKGLFQAKEAMQDCFQSTKLESVSGGIYVGH